MIELYKKTTKIFRSLEKKLLVILMSLLVIVSFTQVVLRIILKVGIPGFDTLINYLVLWIAMVSAGIVVYEGHHIKIDLLSKFAKGKLQILVKFLISFFGGLTSLLFFFIFLNYCISIELFKPFYLNKQANINTFFSFLTSFKSIFIMILPIGFFVIGTRFLNKMLIYAFHIFKKLMRFFNILFSIIFHLVIIFLTVTILVNKYTILNIYILIFSIVISSIFLIINILFLIFEKLTHNPKFYHLLNIPNIIYYLFILILSSSLIIQLTIKNKIFNEVIIFNQASFNLLYTIPMLTLFFIHYSIMHPFVDVLKNFYKEEEEAT